MFLGGDQKPARPQPQPKPAVQNSLDEEFEKQEYELNSKVTLFDTEIEESHNKLEKLDKDIKKLVAERETKITEAKQLRELISNMEQKKLVFINMKLKLEIAISNASSVSVIRQTNDELQDIAFEEYQLNSKVAFFDTVIEESQNNLEKLNKDIRQLVGETKTKIAEAKQLRELIEDMEQKKLVFMNMKLKLEVARNNACSANIIRQTNELIENQEKLNDELQDKAFEKQECELNSKVAYFDTKIEESQNKLEKLNKDIRQLVEEKKKQQAKAKIAEAKHLCELIDYMEQNKLVLINLKLKLEVARNNACLARVIRQTKERMKNQEKMSMRDMRRRLIRKKQSSWLNSSIMYPMRMLIRLRKRRIRTHKRISSAMKDTNNYNN